MTSGTESYAEARSYFPDMGDFIIGPSRYLDILHTASEAVDIPIIGSLNGASRDGWADYAKKMQEAGAKAIELNVYYLPTDLELTSEEVEQRYIDVLTSVKEAVTIPVAVKLSPFFSAMGHMARRLDNAGADGLVLFNRFYQPDFDLEHLAVRRDLNLSKPVELRLPLLWIGVLKGKIKASLAATRGVHSAEDALKYIMAGADVVTMASLLLKRGVGELTTLLKDMTAWMEAHEYESIEQMKGSMSHESVADTAAYERANYIKILETYKTEYTLE
jgi:dihydroorotate dehydrogenase (fumarate)